jgi:hypothetical protein
MANVAPAWDLDLEALPMGSSVRTLAQASAISSELESVATRSALELPS